MHLKKLFLLAALPVIMLAACTPKEDEIQIDPKGQIEGLSENGIVAPSEGAEIELTFHSTAAWRITSMDTKAHASFFLISPAEGPAGDATVKITIDPNETTENRSGKFTIISLDLKKEVTVTQAGKGKVLINSVVLDKTTATLEIGETVTLTATVGPEDTTEDKTVTWATSDAAVATVEDGVVTAVAPGTAVISATAGEIVAKCTVIVNAPEPPASFPDWSGVEGVSEGTYTMFKFAYDDEYVYFYTERSNDDRYAEIWGGAGYVYLAFDLDNNMETGETLWGNGPYEFVGVIYPFAGSAEAPAINEAPGDDCLPETATLENVVCQGTADASGVKIEYRIPRADLPALTESFDVYSWGNKGFSKVKIHIGEPVDDWDYTPSEAYLADDNLWKPVDASNTINWLYNPNWAGELDAPETSFKESTWTVKFVEEDTEAEWTSQLRIVPTTDLLLDTQKKYTFTAQVYSSTGTFVFFKMYEDGVNWPLSFETSPRIEIPAGETKEIKIEDFVPLATPQILLIDFAKHGANNTVHVKDITLKVTGEVTPPVVDMNWDYTPGEEYLADTNIWKAKAAGNEMYYYYHAKGSEWNGSDIISAEVPFMQVNQSTYELTYEDATTEAWMNQFFIFPSEGHFIGFDADKTYKVKLTLAANADMNGFFKISQYDANNTTKHEGPTIWEKGNNALVATEPIVIESPEITGVACDNILMVFDFGGNPAGAKVFIKDITLVEVGAEPPAPAAPKNIAEIIAAIPDSATGNNTAVEFDIDLENPVTVAYMNTTANTVTETSTYSIYIEDESGAMLLYIPNPGIAPGVTIKGKFHVKAYWYNGTPEIVSFTPLENPTWGQVAVPLHEVTIAELLANYDQYFLRKCKVTGITITDAIADGDRSGKASDGTNEIAIYAQLNNKGLVLAKDAFGDLVCIPGVYNTNKQLLFWQNDWFIPGQPSGSTGEDLGDGVDVNPWQ